MWVEGQAPRRSGRVAVMSNEGYNGEDFQTETGIYSVDDEDQPQQGDMLLETELEDELDRGYSPPEKLQGSRAWGTTAWEEAHDETIDQRIQQEEPDPNTAYGAPDNESGLDEPEMLGGDDPDAIPAEDDFVSDAGERAGRLVAPDQGAHEVTDHEEIAQDVGIDGAAATAEEAAMHIVAEEPGVDPLGADDLGEIGPEGLSEAAADAIRDEDEVNESESLAGGPDAR
jgi:hypothetical protein